MFLLMRRDVFEALGGFDERYHLYFEDVDLGCRARLAGYRLVVRPECRIVHAAQRASRRSLRPLLQHTISAIRFFSSPVYSKVRRLPAPAQV